MGSIGVLPVGIGTNATSPPSDNENNIILPKWKGSGNILCNRKASIANNRLRSASSASNVNKIKSTGQFVIKTVVEPHVKLGSYQLQPKGYRLTSGRYGQLKLGLLKIKGTVELEVSLKVFPFHFVR